MELAEKYKKIASLMPAADLKQYCKDTGLRGYSKFNKAGLVDFIATSKSEEELKEFIETTGKKKLESTLKDADRLLNRAPVSGETLTSLNTSGSKVTASFKGMNWNTEFSANVNKIGEPSFEFSCDCRISDSGGLCVHYWTVVLNLISRGQVKPGILGDFEDIVKKRVKAITGKLKEQELEDVSAIAEDLSGLSLDEILKSKTMGTRFNKARAELGLVTPKSTKKIPEPKKEKIVDVKFPINKLDDPANIVAKFYKLEEGNWRQSSLALLIDEEKKILSHENCMDFQMRMAREKKLCKHIIQAFLLLEEKVSRRILNDINGYRFQTTIPESAHVGAGLSSEVLETKPDIQLEDQEGLKNQLLEFLLENEDDETKISVDNLKIRFGDDSENILKIMEKEGMILEFKHGHYKPK
ncbi:MAG: hypothetical protein ACFFCS_18355 [Candidatus Hodarchaeota archaeon]